MGRDKEEREARESMPANGQLGGRNMEVKRNNRGRQKSDKGKKRRESREV